MITTIKCKHCSEALNAPEIKLKEANIVICETGENLTLTYYLCPLCGCRNDTVVDDCETEELFKQYQALASKLVKSLKMRGREPEKQKNRFQSLGNQLKSKRNALLKAYNKSFYLLDDSKEQLDFSLPGAE